MKASVALLLAMLLCGSAVLAGPFPQAPEGPFPLSQRGGDRQSAVVVEKDAPSPGSGATGPLTHQVAPESSNPNRILVVIGCTTPECREFEKKLDAERKNFAEMGWRMGDAATNQVQILDIRRSDHADLVDVYLGDDETRPLPIVVKLEGGKVVREIKHGCGTPFTTWNAYWLYTGKRYENDPGTRERVTVKASGGYPVRGSWWSHSEGNLRRHLLSGQHRGKFDAAWLNSLSGAELESLHSDDHEGRVKWQYVGRTAAVTPRAVRHVQRSFVCPNCPNR